MGGGGNGVFKRSEHGDNAVLDAITRNLKPCNPVCTLLKVVGAAGMRLG